MNSGSPRGGAEWQLVDCRVATTVPRRRAITIRRRPAQGRSSGRPAIPALATPSIRARAAPSGPARGLMTLGRDRERRSGSRKRVDDHMPRVRTAGNVNHGPHVARSTDRDAGRSDHVQRFVEQRLGDDVVDRRSAGRHTPRGRASPSRSSSSRSTDGATDTVMATSGRSTPNDCNSVGTVHDGGDVDHARVAPGRRCDVRIRSLQSTRSRVSATTRRAWSSTGAADGRNTRRRPTDSNNSHADPPFEFGQTLRQRRRTDADPLGGGGPRRLVGDGDEVLELADRDVGQIGERRHRHAAQISSVLLH